MGKNRYIFAIALPIALSGCATNKMTHTDNTESVEKISKSLLLMTVTLRNTVKPEYRPKLRSVNLRRPGSQDQKNRKNGLSFIVNDRVPKKRSSENDAQSYLLRMRLEDGTYSITGLGCSTSGFLITAFCAAPVFVTFTIRGPGVYYLGHIEATIRPRNGDEFRAGPVIPHPIGQAVSGFAGGTFDIAITDASEHDIPDFVSRFHDLQKVEIKKKILPAWDRANAQKWWNGDLKM